MPTISFDQLDAALNDVLRQYAKDAEVDVDAATKEAVATLVKLTRGSAPRGTRKRAMCLNAYGDGQARPHFFTSITSRKQPTGGYLWYVKKPNLRITHLIAKSHASRGGGSVRGDPFLVNSLQTTLQEYMENLRKVLTK